MSEEQDVVGEVIVRLKPVMSDDDVRRETERAVASAQNAQNVAGMAQASASRASGLANSVSTPSMSGVESQFTRGAITTRLMNEMRPEIERVMQDRYEQAGDVAGPFTFASSRLPSEITRQLQGHPNAKAIRGLFTTGVRGGSGMDLLSSMGEDAYFEYAEAVAGSPRAAAIKTALREGTPYQQVMAGLANQQPFRGGLPLPPMEMQNVSTFETGTKFKIAQHQASIIEPDEGQKMLRLPFLKHDLPLEAIGHLPVDINSIELPAPADISNFGDSLGGSSGRRIPLQQYRRNQLGLPGPSQATRRFAEYHQTPEELAEQQYHERVADVRARQRQMNQPAFDPTSDLNKIKELEGYLPDASRQGKDILTAAIHGMKERLKSMGVDPDMEVQPLITPSQVMSNAYRMPKGLPGPSFQTTSAGDGRYRGGNRGGGVGGTVGGGFEDEDHPRNAIAPWGMTGRRRGSGGSAGGGGRGGGPPDDIIDVQWHYERKALPGYGDTIRHPTFVLPGASGGRGGRRGFFDRIRRNFQAARIHFGRAGGLNQNVLSNGMFMNVLFGGGELLRTGAAMGAAERMTSITSNMQQRAQIQLQAYQTASGGFLGSFANFAIDPLGIRQGNIGATLDVSARADAYLNSQKEVAQSLSLLGARTPLTGAGQLISGLAGRMRGIASSRDQMLNEDREGRKALVDRAAQNAGEQYDHSNLLGINLKNEMFPYTRGEWVEAARKNASDADANAGIRFANDIKAAKGAEAREAYDSSLRTMWATTDENRIIAHFSGAPVQAQRAVMSSRQASARAEFLGNQNSYMDARMKAGATQREAFKEFAGAFASLTESQGAESDVFEGNVAHSQQVADRSSQDDIGIMNATSYLYEGGSHADERLDYARDRQQAKQSFQKWKKLGMSDEEATAHMQQEVDANRTMRGARRNYTYDQRRRAESMQQTESVTGRALNMAARGRTAAANQALNKGGAKLGPVLASLRGQYEQEGYGLGRSGGNIAEAGSLMNLYQQEVEGIRSQFLSDFKPTTVSSINSIDTSGRDFNREIGAINNARGGASSIGNSFASGYSQFYSERFFRLSTQQMQDASAGW